jgi:membrane-bound metal-dependent hydrolase YbcI (DUF457 family)
VDFFTHLAISLLISTIVSGSIANIYVFFGILLGIIPDFDFLLFPFWKRLPLAGHHGITHMFAFILLFAAFIYILLSLSFGISDLKFLFLMILTGSLHIIGDFIGTGGVKPLYPLEKGYSNLNIDLGNNPCLMAFSFLGIAFLVAASFGYIPRLSVISAAAILGSAYILYYAIRALVKIYDERKSENYGFVALPTVYPWEWKFARRIDTIQEIEINLKTEDGINRYKIPKQKQDTIKTCQDLVYSYWHPSVQAQMRFFKYPCYRIVCEGDKKEIIWNSVEAGKLTEVHVNLNDEKLEVSTHLREKRH